MLGVWVAVFLFLGLPSGWLKGIAVISGLIILAVSYTLPAPRKTETKLQESFVENKQQ